MYKLREIKREDISVINKWRNNRAIRDSLGSPFCFVTEDMDNKWYENYLLSRTTTLRCAIVEERVDVILGLVTLSSINQKTQSAEFHIMVGEESQGKGVGSFAVVAMIRHAFEDLNISRITLTVLEENKRAQHIYEKAGFEKEGVMRLSAFNNGKYKNMIIYAIMREDRKLIGGGNYLIISTIKNVNRRTAA